MMRRWILFLMVSSYVFAANSIMAQAQSDTKVEVGVHFTSIIASDPPAFPRFNRTRWIPGFGAVAGYNLTNNLSVETEFNLFPRGDENDRIGEGEKIQGLFGIKAGVRRNGIGFFGKLRPGFMHFSEPILESPEEEFIRRPLPKFRFALDIGGVVEVYASDQMALRFDIGDTLIRFPDVRRSVSEPGFPTRRFTIEGGTTHNLQFSAGIVFRF